MRSKGFKCYNYHCKGRIGDSSLCGEPGGVPLDCVERVIREDTTDKRCATCALNTHELFGNGGVCMNDRSDFFCDWTGDGFCCAEWESPETEK